MENPKVPGMVKTPEEIKKGLECCYSPVERCEECPYKGSVACRTHLRADALAYIQWLEAENVRLNERVEIANSSPFPQGMSQAEYFGLERDAVLYEYDMRDENYITVSYKDMTFCTRKGCKYTHCHRHYSNIPLDELPEYMGVSVGDMYGTEVHCKLLLTEPPFNPPGEKGKKDGE